MEKRFLRFPTVKRTALSAETYVSHMKNVRFRCRIYSYSCCQGVPETGKA